MSEETKESPVKQPARSGEAGPRVLRALLFAVLGVTLVLAALNVAQLVFTNRLLQTLAEDGPLAQKLEGVSKSVDGLTVLVDANGKLSSDVNGIGANVNTLTGLLRDLGAGEAVPAVPGLANASFHLHFVCTDAATGASVSACPVQVKVLAAEPATDFTVQGNNTDPITLPLRLRLSIAAQASGYKPYASVFEFTESGVMQEYAIKLEK